MTNERVETDLVITALIQLYYDLYIPPDREAPCPLLIAVHGYGAHKRYMMREAQLVAPGNFAIASIQGPHQHYRPAKGGGYRVGFGWLSEHKPKEYIHLHHSFVLDVIAKLVADGIADPTQVFIYGFSQACALNFRFAFSYSTVLKGIVAVCGGIPGDLDTNPVYRASAGDTLYLFGDDDEFYAQEQFKKFDETLNAFLPKYRSKQYSARHEITDEMRADISGWLTDLT